MDLLERLASGTVLSILVGAVLLTFALYPATRIVTGVPAGLIRHLWVLLCELLALFVAGYLVCAILISQQPEATISITAMVFLLGASLACLICWLSYHTLQAIRRGTEVTTDPRLGIYNRPYLDQRLREEVDRAQRYYLPCSLLLLELDDFKRIQGAYGSTKGELIFKGLVQLLRGMTRESDVLARYAGPQLAVVLPNTTEERARETAERLRRLVEGTALATDGRTPPGNELHCTVSVGVAGLTDADEDGSRMVHMAETALAQAKTAGGNRVGVYSPAAEGSR